MPGEKDELFYLPLGVGVIVPPWNFPLAIMVGMTTAALVAGNTVVIKPSSDTPTIAAKFAEVLLDAGLPAAIVFDAGGQRRGGGRRAGGASARRASSRSPDRKEVGLRINELAAKPHKGQIWIKRVIAEMGGKDAIVVDREADLDSAVKGVLWSAFGYQGQKCSACSRAIVDAGHLRRVRGEAEGRSGQAEGGAVGRAGELHGSGDQRRRHEIDSGIHRDRQEGRPADGRRRGKRRATAISCSRP